MKSPLTVEITSGAKGQISHAVAWWAENRPAAPGAVIEDLTVALDLLASNPEVGTKIRSARTSGVRRITLARIRYYLFYRVAGEKLQVLALWHTSRGKGPLV